MLHCTDSFDEIINVFFARESRPIMETGAC